ncbi:colanic acid biosynthesis acetyltransferase WcaF [Alloacidobacterium dinghuense]|uniref:Colanic acid biosynthesis acetyltransferase WcaF n=1 Tax=Alloacidobacterium dinghuense TaxID=2763107 RepID=A0A7G8BHZ6_9BACT|nr:putative colanic acid biosynthesis acetyltransferase [Alloacidobacterium dinghuense]QNI32166.1 colanic acid biosynthesis acetyltransferase WcaF [Alloacidobacterium dinghuense]
MTAPSRSFEPNDRIAITGPVQDLSAHHLPPNFRGRPAWFVQTWWLVQSLLFHTSPQVLYGWRRFLLKLFGAKIGKNVMFRPSVSVTYPWKLTIGEDCWIGDHVTLYTLGPIVIGNDTVISQHSYLAAASHDYTKPSFDIFAKQITVEDEVWIAAHCFIGPGVTVGRGAVVGSCSVTFKDVPPMMVCMGNPLKVIRPRVVTDTATR